MTWHRPSGAEWTLSSQLESDFVFERPADRFYQPHDVQQLASHPLGAFDGYS
jgi:hypothetical protein